VQTTSISPMLSVRDGSKAIEFSKSALGANVSYQISSPDGAIVAKLSIGEAEFWLADESPENDNYSPQTLGGSTTRVVLVVDDPDSMFDRAISAGATEVWPVADQPYGWRQGRLVDPFGHHWEIGKPLESKH
jgi:PhnB protein